VAPKELSELQLAVMRALWEVGEGGVSDVQAALGRGGRELAPTTVATLLRRLEKQGWVSHRDRGQKFVYRANVSRQEATGSALDRIMHAFFGGDVPAFVAQLLESDHVAPGDLERMRALIAAKEGKKS
jgi:BlaI family penicillinase repressor